VSAWPGPPPLGVVVDLDDTIYPQAAFLRGAAAEVGRAADAAGLDGGALTRALDVELRSGSDRGGTIDRALAAIGVPAERAAAALPGLVAAFLGHRPAQLELYPGARAVLVALGARYPVACLTDGAPAVQWAKLTATGVAEAVDAVVVTDELGGRAFRKPHPAGLLRAAELLGVPAESLVVVGDRPGKDVAVAAAVGARSIRVRTGEYADAPDEPAATLTVPDLAAAAEVLCALVPPRTGAPASAGRPAG
jgi:FMN phosphatase YigB (HAD superfamily)